MSSMATLKIGETNMDMLNRAMRKIDQEGNFMSVKVFPVVAQLLSKVHRTQSQFSHPMAPRPLHFTPGKQLVTNKNLSDDRDRELVLFKVTELVSELEAKFSTSHDMIYGCM